MTTFWGRHPLRFETRRVLPEQVFLAVGLVAGILSVLLTPPFRGADEPKHLFRTYQISEGFIVAERKDADVGGLLPRTLKDLPQRAHPYEEPRNLLERVLSRLTPLNPDDRIFVDFRNTALYAPVPYLPQALVIGVARAFEGSPFVLLYLGRFTGLLAALALTFLAIRITPIGKRLFVLLAVTPMALRQMTLLTADSVTNACSFLLIAMFLRLALDPEAHLSGRWLVLVILCSLVVSLSKVAYFPLTFLYFLCPVEKVGSRRRYFATFCGIAGLNALALIAWFWAIRSLYAPQYIAPDADPARQMAFILSHPLSYVLILLDDVRNNGRSYLGQCFGYVGHVPESYGWLHQIVLMWVAFVDGEKGSALGVRAKALILAVAVSTVGLIDSLNYLGWNAVGSGTISFIQGRYYVPITPLPFLLLSNRRFVGVFAARHLTFLAAGFSVFVASLAIRFLVLRWYGI